MGAILTRREFALLEKLENGGVVAETERRLAHRLASLGVVRLGYDDSHRFVETGHLSQIGRYFLETERAEKTILGRLVHRYLRPLFGIG